MILLYNSKENNNLRSAGQVGQNVYSVMMVRWSKRQDWLIVKCARVQVLVSDMRISFSCIFFTLLMWLVVYSFIVITLGHLFIINFNFFFFFWWKNKEATTFIHMIKYWKHLLNANIQFFSCTLCYVSHLIYLSI